VTAAPPGNSRVRPLLGLAARRAVEAVPLLLLVSGIGFGLLQLVPGGPLEVYLSNPGVRPEDLERLRRALGLDRSIGEQYVSWLAAFVRGDWGFSFSDGRPVLDRIVERLPASIELLAASLVLALLAAIPAGIVAAVTHRSFVDRSISAVAAAGVSIPTFWLGLMLQLTFAIALGWLPSSGRGADGTGFARLQYLIMPSVVLAFGHGVWTCGGVVAVPARIADRGVGRAVHGCGRRPRRGRARTAHASCAAERAGAGGGSGAA
jgi:peptide/nickel transport system permease protein